MEQQQQQQQTDETGDLATTSLDENTDTQSAAAADASAADTTTQQQRRAKKRKKKSYDETTLVDLLPSHARKTKNGGYAHTNKSKSKISMANAGNTPWNKGKNRSSADRAKIAAGVRARNRTVLLEKLKRLGLTEEEYETKKRQIKYLRERLRRAKKSNAQHKAADAAANADVDAAEAQLRQADVAMKLQAAIDATTEKKTVATNDAKKKPSNLVATTKEEPNETVEEEKKEESVKDIVEEVFSKDVVWTPCPLGNNEKDIRNNTSVSKGSSQNTKKSGMERGELETMCPVGGPGGLICCNTCAKQYTNYLNRTVKDMEVQRTHRIGMEVKELLDYLAEGRNALERSHNVAKKKVPPLPPTVTPKARVIRAVSAATRHSSGSDSKNSNNKKNNNKNHGQNTPPPTHWDATSAMDIALNQHMFTV